MNGPGQTWRRGIRAGAAGAALLLSALTPVHPASIERRPDGTLLVKAQGEHFVFSERDEQRIFFLGPKLRGCAENYDFRVSIPEESGAMPATSSKGKKGEAGPIEHVVVVRVYDRFENMSSAKTVIRGK